MKILIVGPENYANRALAKAVKVRGHRVKLASIVDFCFVLKDKKFIVKIGRQDIRDFDICLIRGIYPYMEKAHTIAKYLKRCGKEVVDRELYRKVYVFDKMFGYAALSYHGLPCPDCWYFSDIKEFKKSGVKLPFPVLVKDIQGMHGKNIFNENSNNQLLKFLSKHKINDFFIQEIIEADHYYRVFVIGNESVGSIKRYTLSYLKNHRVPLAQRSQKHVLSKKQKDLAVRAAKAANTDIAGVDLIYDRDGKPYILEVNRCPGFERLSLVTGINIADRIIKFLEKVYREKK
ncbi:MAG TPA: ATP-grasp domain-containing protein [Candidatus Bipolaricaulota bacterium]|nr:ATP-grasp domain-containing protein [Candidatus Bipolaricaulota bacterium]